MAGNGNPQNSDAMAKFKKMAMEHLPGSSWGPWLLGKVLGNGQTSFENPRDYRTTVLERKKEKISELENALENIKEEEKKKIEKKEREKAKLKEDKEKHRIADQKIKDLNRQVENAKNKKKAENNVDKFKHLKQNAVRIDFKGSK